MLSVADWAVVAVYLVGVTTVGLMLSRGQRSRRDYFLGGRTLSWWVVGLSIVATETSALTFIGVPAMAIGALRVGPDGALTTVGGNLYFLQIVVGYIIARVVVAIVMVPHYFAGDVYTPYQLLRRAFGPLPRYLAAVLAILNMCLQAGARVYVTAIPLMIVLRPVVPGWGIWHSILLFTGVSIVYTSLGGIRAVVWTDMVQFFVFFAGGLFAVLYIPTLLQAASGATGWAALGEIGGDKLSVLNWGLAPRQAGQGLWSWIGASLARIFGGDFNIWMGLVGATVGVMVSHGADQLNVQRVLACRSARDGRRALVLSAAIIGPQFLVFLLIGAGLYAFYAAGGFDFGGLPPWDPTQASPAPKADYLFPIFIVTRMPPVVKGFLVAGILASAMSSLTSALTAISSVAVIDLLRPLTGMRDDPRRDMAVGRAGTLLAGLALVVVAWWAKDAPLVFNLVFQFAGIFSGAKLGSLLFAMWTRGGRPGPVLCGMVTSVLVMAAVVWLTRSSLVSIHWPWYPFIGTAVCLGVARALTGRPSVPEGQGIDVPAADE
jgi:SSS family solute:Na+ symporter